MNEAYIFDHLRTPRGKGRPDGALHSVSPVLEGGATSYFQIPAWVKNGVIHLKAYTQWMLNFDNSFRINAHGRSLPQA